MRLTRDTSRDRPGIARENPGIARETGCVICEVPIFLIQMASLTWLLLMGNLPTKVKYINNYVYFKLNETQKLIYSF